MTEKKSRKNGFTLVELLVTVTILSIVTLLTVQLSNAFFRRYAMIEARWTVQNAAKRVMQYFESENESLANSTSVSLYYTEPEKRGTVAASADASVMQGVPATGNDTYAYIYTMPASDPTQGDVIWVLERGEGKTPVNLTEYILEEEIPLNIEFNVSTVPIEVSKGETIVNADGTTTVPYTYGGGEDAYLTNTVDVTISTPQSVGGNFTLTTSFTMNNIMQNQQINYENGAVCETEGDAYIAGWSNENIACPVDTTAERMDYATQSANILRYISTESFLNSQNTDTADFSAEGAGLCFGALCMEGSAVGTQVKGALRDFRDNVLAKSDFGNRIIDQYYNEWSPALLSAAKEHPSLKTFGKIVLIPASVVAFFAAE
ncbi:MAG: type II secretion system protein J [Candidatus Fimenecus sp.]